ncbi:MAG: DUF4239 domain-containing protein [Cyanobacteria bacterium]|nr:DUF4239 domain-containing protein [Cyanobacteriota bacterium]
MILGDYLNLVAFLPCLICGIIVGCLRCQVSFGHLNQGIVQLARANKGVNMFNISEVGWWCLCSIVLALIGFFITRKLIVLKDMEIHQPFLDATLTIVGTLVSILLGLLVANSIDYYESIQDTADNEAAAVADIVRLARGLPASTRIAITNLCVQYNQTVQYEEWKAMESGTMSTKAGLLCVHINDEIVDFMPANDKENNIHNALIGCVQQLGEHRHIRIMALHSTWCRRILPVMFLCAFIVFAYTYLYTRRDKRILHAVVICFVAVPLAANLAMIFLLRTPFSTDWKVQPSGFRLNEDLMKKYPKVYK